MYSKEEMQIIGQVLSSLKFKPGESKLCALIEGILEKTKRNIDDWDKEAVNQEMPGEVKQSVD